MPRWKLCGSQQEEACLLFASKCWMYICLTAKKDSRIVFALGDMTDPIVRSVCYVTGLAVKEWRVRLAEQPCSSLSCSTGHSGSTASIPIGCAHSLTCSDLYPALFCVPINRPFTCITRKTHHYASVISVTPYIAILWSPCWTYVAPLSSTRLYEAQLKPFGTTSCADLLLSQTSSWPWTVRAFPLHCNYISESLG